MEQPLDWKIRLNQVLNHPQFFTANDKQRLEVLEEALRQSQLPVADFNQAVIELWRTSNPVPQLSIYQNYTDQHRLTYVAPKRAYISPREVFIYQDSLEESADTELLQNVEKFIWDEFSYDSEKLLKPLKDLVAEIQTQINLWHDAAVPINRIEHLQIASNWKDRFDFSSRVVIRNRHCRNQEDPWDETPILSIIDSEYLHLSNGMCWHVNSFMEYVRGVNGVNDSKDLPGYTSPHIWESEDLERILHHPAIIAAGFDVWLKQILSASSYQVVTFETVEALYRLASILVSRGNPFHRELQRTITPAMYKAYWQYTKGNSDDVFKIPVSEGQSIIRDIIKNKLKSEAFDDFIRYYQALSTEEKSALELLYPGFERDLTFCDAGRLCVYVLAKNAYNIYGRLAELKGIKPLQLDVTER